MLTFFIAIFCIQLALSASNEKASIFFNFNFASGNNEQAKEILLKSFLAPQTKQESFWQKINNNKLKTTVIIFFSSWAMVQLTILVLERKMNWSSWKSEITIENLFIRSNVNLVEELKQKVKEQNQNNIKKTLLEIELEEQALNFHSKLVKTLNKLWLSKLFWFNNELFTKNKEKILRLRIIKRLVNENLT